MIKPKFNMRNLSRSDQMRISPLHKAQSELVAAARAVCLAADGSPNTVVRTAVAIHALRERIAEYDKVKGE